MRAVNDAERTNRRHLLRAALGAALGTAAVGGLIPLLSRKAWTRDGDLGQRRLDDRRRLSIRRGCDYLAEQQRNDGGFGETDKAVVALTSLSVLALLSDGSTDGRGRYGDHVRRGIDFLLRLVKDRPPDLTWHEGYFYHPHDQSSRMHGQGYATLALATALGSSTGKRYSEIHGTLRKAVECIEQSQTQSGGFGYDPVSTGDHEGSVTVTVAQGLRAARDAGLIINENIVRKGLKYLKRSQKDDGSFSYSIYVDRSSYALTAAALSSFFLYGAYDDEQGDDTIQRGLEYMMRQLPSVIARGQWYYYGNFYAAWTVWQKDGNDWDPRGRGYWARWHHTVYPDMIAKQRRGDGGWHDEYDRFKFGDVLPTAFAVLTLAIPDEVIPIFQR